jgi:hypothetical protein
MARIGADANFCFMPTEKSEVYRILACLGTPHLNEYNPVELKDALAYANTISDYRFYQEYRLIHYLIEEKQFDLIDKYFYFSIGYSFGKQKSLTILDPFAGEGEWLNTIKKNTEHSVSIAVEIEKSRYDKIEADVKLHSAFEDSDIPKKSVKLLLFNPPYGSTNGVRNVKNYLSQLIEKKVMADEGVMVAVIRGDDLLDCADILFDNFNLREHYRVNDAEFDRYKQFVLYFNTFQNRLSGIQKATQFTAFKQRLEEIVQAAEPFKTSQYGFIPSIGTGVNWEALEGLHKKSKQFQNSGRDKVWDWVTKSRDAKLGDNFELLMPRAPKVGEISNILASGVINGKIDAINANHIVAGGVRRVSRRETFIEDTANGPVEKVRETKLSKPFLNILVRQEGKVVIKSIEGSTS